MNAWKKFYLKFVGAAAIDATIFALYRVYFHFRNNRLMEINIDEYKPFKEVKIATLNFNGVESNKQLLNKLSLNNYSDGSVYYYEFKTVLIAIKKQDKSKFLYDIFIDLGGCYDTKRTPVELVKSLLTALEIDTLKPIWVNRDFESESLELIKKK